MFLGFGHSVSFVIYISDLGIRQRPPSFPAIAHPPSSPPAAIYVPVSNWNSSNLRRPTASLRAADRVHYDPLESHVRQESATAWLVRIANPTPSSGALSSFIPSFFCESQCFVLLTLGEIIFRTRRYYRPSKRHRCSLPPQPAMPGKLDIRLALAGTRGLMVYEALLFRAVL